jgi:hypothetical protein
MTAYISPSFSDNIGAERLPLNFNFPLAEIAVNNWPTAGKDCPDVVLLYHDIKTVQNLHYSLSVYDVAFLYFLKQNFKFHVFASLPIDRAKKSGWNKNNLRLCCRSVDNGNQHTMGHRSPGNRRACTWSPYFLPPSFKIEDFTKTLSK